MIRMAFPKRENGRRVELYIRQENEDTPTFIGWIESCGHFRKVDTPIENAHYQARKDELNMSQEFKSELAKRLRRWAVDSDPRARSTSLLLEAATKLDHLEQMIEEHNEALDLLGDYSSAPAGLIGAIHNVIGEVERLTRQRDRALTCLADQQNEQWWENEDGRRQCQK